MKAHELGKYGYTTKTKNEIMEAVKSELPEANHLMINFDGAIVSVFGEHSDEDYANDFAKQYDVYNSTDVSGWEGGHGSSPSIYSFYIVFNATEEPNVNEQQQPTVESLQAENDVLKAKVAELIKSIAALRHDVKANCSRIEDCESKIDWR